MVKSVQEEKQDTLLQRYEEEEEEEVAAAPAGSHPLAREDKGGMGDHRREQGEGCREV